MKEIENYINSLDDEKKEVVSKLRNIVKDSIENGFEETFNYGMINYVVPLSIYPSGYLGRKEGLPYIAIASQKNYISLYHMGLYGDEELLNWFKEEYEKLGIGKLDMGKSCIRFKNISKIPFGLIAELLSKTTVNDMIRLYEKK